MTSQDPVLEALKELEKQMPKELKPLVIAYEEGGIIALTPAWKLIIVQAMNANR